MTFILDRLFHRSMNRQTKPLIHWAYALLAGWSLAWITLRLFIWQSMPHVLFAAVLTALMAGVLGCCIGAVVLARFETDTTRRLNMIMLASTLAIPPVAYLLVIAVTGSY